MELTRYCVEPDLTTTSLDFTFYRGITFRALLSFKNPNDTALVLTGIVVTFRLKDTSDDTEYLSIASDDSPNTNGSSIIITNASNGQAEILLTDEETALIDFDDAKWLVTLTLVNGDIVIKGKGLVEIKEPYD